GGVGPDKPKDRATGDVVAGKAHRYSKDVRMPGRDIDGTIRAGRQPADHSILPVRGGAVVLIDESDQLEQGVLDPVASIATVGPLGSRRDVAISVGHHEDRLRQ